MTEYKNERQYEILLNMFESKYDSAIFAGNGFRVCKNKEGSKVPFRLEVKKDMLNKTLGQIIEEENKRYEAAKSGQQGGGYSSSSNAGGGSGGRW